jgi:putative flavoprotein involved in K+ transport
MHDQLKTGRALRPRSNNHCSVIIVGGGQAGLSMSYCLKERGIDHLIFEKQRLAESWRSKRWDTFCLVTPNWQCKLPGFDYQGNDPHGFMQKDEIVHYIEAYARSFQPPLREGVAVQRLARHESGFFELNTTVGDYFADQVVVATGAYHVPTIPRFAERFPARIEQLDSSNYKIRNHCRRMRYSWSDRDNPAAKSRRISTSRVAAFICALAAPRGPLGGTAARTSSPGCIR